MKINNLTKKALDFEQTKSLQMEQQLKNYKLFAYVSLLLAFLAILAVCLLAPFKTVVPYVIQVDKDNGDTRIITAMNSTEELNVDEAVDQFNIVRYINAREGYIFETLRKDYDLVIHQTSEKILSDFTSKYQGESNRAEILKDTVTVKMRIKSITLSNSNNAKVATVRLSLIRHDLTNNVTEEKNVIVTMTYQYNHQSTMTQTERYENPFGFVVTSYKVNTDND